MKKSTPAFHFVPKVCFIIFLSGITVLASSTAATSSTMMSFTTEEPEATATSATTEQLTSETVDTSLVTSDPDTTTDNNMSDTSATKLASTNTQNTDTTTDDTTPEKTTEEETNTPTTFDYGTTETTSDETNLSFSATSVESTNSGNSVTDSSVSFPSKDSFQTQETTEPLSTSTSGPLTTGNVTNGVILSASTEKSQGISSTKLGTGSASISTLSPVTFVGSTANESMTPPETTFPTDLTTEELTVTGTTDMMTSGNSSVHSPETTFSAELTTEDLTRSTVPGSTDVKTTNASPNASKNKSNEPSLELVLGVSVGGGVLLIVVIIIIACVIVRRRKANRFSKLSTQDILAERENPRNEMTFDDRNVLWSERGGERLGNLYSDFPGETNYAMDTFGYDENDSSYVPPEDSYDERNKSNYYDGSGDFQAQPMSTMKDLDTTVQYKIKRPQVSAVPIGMYADNQEPDYIGVSRNRSSYTGHTPF